MLNYFTSGFTSGLCATRGRPSTVKESVVIIEDVVLGTAIIN